MLTVFCFYLRIPVPTVYNKEIRAPSCKKQYGNKMSASNGNDKTAAAVEHTFTVLSFVSGLLRQEVKCKVCKHKIWLCTDVSCAVKM